MRFIAILILLFYPVNIFSQDCHYTIDTIEVKSDILTENRSIIIYRPDHISGMGPVRFIYLLDGESADYRYQYLHKQFKDSISDLVAVGIINTDRRRDLLYINSADKFLDFITIELIPLVEKNYKTANRILYGHSFAGSFALYSLLNKPGFFNCYIASSPTPIMDLINMESYRKLDEISKDKVLLCLSFGSDDMKQVRKWALRLKEILSGMELKNLYWRFRVFEGKNHNNSDVPALINGLDSLK